MADDSPIVVRAGTTAARRLRGEGLRPESFGTLIDAGSLADAIQPFPA
jgi:hypothetical protein